MSQFILVGELIRISQTRNRRALLSLQLFPCPSAYLLPIVIFPICLILHLSLQTLYFQSRGVCEIQSITFLFPLIPCCSSENSYSSEVIASTFFSHSESIYAIFNRNTSEFYFFWLLDRNCYGGVESLDICHYLRILLLTYLPLSACMHVPTWELFLHLYQINLFFFLLVGFHMTL